MSGSEPVPRRQLTGIRRDQYGYRAYVKVGAEQRTKRFPPNAKTKTMQAWRDEAKVALRKLRSRVTPAHSLAADVARYLLQVRSMPTYEQRALHLELWLTALGRDTPRASITPEQIRTVLQDWRRVYGPATCNKRRSALMHVWSLLDGRGASNPVRTVPKFPAPHALPRGRDPHTIDAALKLTTLSRMRACCRVMLWTGMRPSELQRAQPGDVNDKAAIVRTVKGGRVRVVPLTSQAVEAWKEFDAAECWQRVPQAAPMNRWLKKRTGLPDLRVYDLRHSYGTALARRQTRLDVIGALMGHSTLELTKRYTLAALTPDALTATDRLETDSGTDSGNDREASESGGQGRK